MGRLFYFLVFSFACNIFYVNGQNITSAEYFFDVDPGVGGGKALFIQNEKAINLETEVNISHLNVGFHTLYFRLKDNRGTWGLSEGRGFFITVIPTVNQRELKGAEYFFDQDPGLGNGIPISIDQDGRILAEIQTGGISDGFHQLYVRSSDTSGTWSLFEVRPFLVSTITVPSGKKLKSAEYFINNDPGTGNGIGLALGKNNELLAEIPTEGLLEGFNQLYIRFQDDAGVWGLSEIRSFFVDSRTNKITTIIAAEYFFGDEDPGNGNGIPIDIEAGRTIEIERLLDLAGLPLGKQKVHVRFQDDLGAWSYNEVREFTIATPGIEILSPSVGGNIGDVTINILGSAFDANSKVKLIKSGAEDIVVPDSLIAVFNGEQIQAILDLRGKEIGDYDVMVTLEDGTSLIKSNGFSVIEGIHAHPWAEIIGFDRIRIGQWQTYTVTYGNRGNVDATGVPLWIQIPENSEYKLDFDLFKPETNTLSWDSIPDSFIADSIPGIQKKARIIPLVIPNMAPDELGTLTFKLKTDSSEEFVISAWASSPMYQSPLTQLASPA